MNPVGWFEIYVEDLERATEFYSSVFQVELTKLESPVADIQMMGFPMEMHAAGASGTLVKMRGVSPGGNSVMVYFACEDCGVEASRVEAAGGKLQKPKTSIGEYGFMAVALDTEGNVLGLHSAE